MKPGDLIHAYQHGVIVIPHEIAKDVAKAARELEAREKEMVAYCQSKGFTLEGLKELYGRARARR